MHRMHAQPNDAQTNKSKLVTLFPQNLQQCDANANGALVVARGQRVQLREFARRKHESFGAQCIGRVTELLAAHIDGGDQLFGGGERPGEVHALELRGVRSGVRGRGGGGGGGGR